MLALRELHRAAPTPVDIVALPAGAPFGAVEVNADGCTLCLACVSACPTGALGDDPERPLLRFKKMPACSAVSCKATCPEKVISLKPQLDFRAVTALRTHPQARRAVLLHPVRQAVRCQEHHRAREHKSSKASTGCIRKRLQTPRSDQDVRRLPRRRGDRRRVRSPRRPAASERAHHRRLSARARGT